MVRYEYNDLDQLVKVTWPGEEIATYVYDENHHLIELSDPGLLAGSKREKFTYDRGSYEVDGLRKRLVQDLVRRNLIIQKRP